MSNLRYIEHVLANYFSANTGDSDSDAIAHLRQHMASSPILAAGLLDEVKRAFSDPDYPWRELLAKHDVLYADNEDEAREYAKGLFLEIAEIGPNS